MEVLFSIVRDGEKLESASRGMLSIVAIPAIEYYVVRKKQAADVYVLA